ncbi:hypothetical protein SCHPADRAFT_910367 [Schizopora paradoxa]|uniref:Uncharacterized protein n=1 Tax=Schizopora paradoxa TaxID=27342 RepID=A0A0H2RNN9_9AGAM|nr:hypothetical protein SCHPADRAFT_910367 [Schizopora paradoxa]
MHDKSQQHSNNELPPERAESPLTLSHEIARRGENASSFKIQLASITSILGPTIRWLH